MTREDIELLFVVQLLWASLTGKGFKHLRISKFGLDNLKRSELPKVGAIGKMA